MLNSKYLLENKILEDIYGRKKGNSKFGKYT